jgi:tetratricopeptide (TPR) repeat protein
MNAIPPTSLPIRYTRMLLIKTGLTEDEADKLIERIAADAAATGTRDNSQRLAIIEQELAKLASIKTGRISSTVVIGAISGVAGNYLTRGIDWAVGNLPTLKPTESLPNQSGIELIRAEWAGCRLQGEPPELRWLLTRAMKVHEERDGSINPLTALYLDAIGMVMDWQGDHRQAEQVRRQAVKISRKVNGPTHESTAAALSNLGLCLHARGKEIDSAKCFIRAATILQGNPTPDQISLAAVIYNIYDCWRNSPKFVPTWSKLPPEFKKAIPELQKFGQGMAALKLLIVGLISLRDMFYLLGAYYEQQQITPGRISPELARLMAS